MDEIEKKARKLLAAEFDAADLLGARDRIADNQPLTPVEKAALRAIAAALRETQTNKVSHENP